MVFLIPCTLLYCTDLFHAELTRNMNLNRIIRPIDGATDKWRGCLKCQYCDINLRLKCDKPCFIINTIACKSCCCKSSGYLQTSI